MAAGSGTLAAIVADPLFGRPSDRSRSRFGRRRPWIVVGLLCMIAGATFIGLRDSLGVLLLDWVIMPAFVTGRASLWVSPILPLQLQFAECRQPVTDRSWVFALLESAHTSLRRLYARRARAGKRLNQRLRSRRRGESGSGVGPNRPEVDRPRLDRALDAARQVLAHGRPRHDR
ncbi:MFS transporter [Rathayibacter sp. AY2B5]|uniref:DUF7882 family protein n=1 Tax=Rathayibacter sp. AY2B5 TaxID=2080570 RepID=UPI0011B0B314